MRVRIGGWALMTALAALPFGSVAQATDMPVKALPPVAAGVNWTGFYVGGHIGYGWGNKDFSLPDIAGEKFGDCTGSHQECFDLSKLGEFRFVNCWYDVSKEIYLKAHTEVNWVATLAGRVGYAVDRVLIYAKGGVAFADQDYNWIVTKGTKDLATAKFS